MAWAFHGNMYGAPPVIMRMQIGADCYVGQVVQSDASNGYGHVIPAAVAGAGPDVTSNLVGVITGVVNSPSYDSSYQGDKATYDSSQANQVDNDPKGPTEVEVTIMRPGDLWRAPIGKVTATAALDTVTATSADTAGDDIIHTADTITAPTSKYATIYCRSGANRGQYRVITAGGTTDQDVTVCFTYDIAVGDVFVCANVVLGPARIDFTTNILGIDGDTSVSNYYDVFCHKLNLEEAGKEYAVVSFAAHHLWATR